MKKKVILFVVSLVASIVLLFFYRRFCDWVPILEKETNRKLVQIYPVNTWYGHVTKKKARIMFNEGTYIAAIEQKKSESNPNNDDTFLPPPNICFPPTKSESI